MAGRSPGSTSRLDIRYHKPDEQTRVFIKRVLCILSTLHCTVRPASVSLTLASRFASLHFGSYYSYSTCVTRGQPRTFAGATDGCDWKWGRSCRLKPAFRPQWNAGFSRQPRSAHPHLITPSNSEHRSGSQFILPFGVEQLVGALVVRLRDEHFGGPAQIAIGRQAGIGKLLRGADAVLGEHYHQQFGVHERACVKEFHPRKFNHSPREGNEVGAGPH